MRTQETVREKIVRTFAEWAAFSATRSGCPIKKTEQVYKLIKAPNYEEIFDEKNFIYLPEFFDEWHRENAKKIVKEANEMRPDVEFPFGWAAKLIDVYLKTRVYIGGEGHPDLVKCIHPPIDNQRLEGIKEKYGANYVIMGGKNRVKAIKDINEKDYEEIIKYCRGVAKAEKCYLIEADKLWQWPNKKESQNGE